MASKVKDYMTSTEFVAWMDEHGWSVPGLAATGYAGGVRTIYRMREGTLPVAKVLGIALPAINRKVSRRKRGAK